MRAPGQSNQLEAGLRIGDFEIEKRLGAGGMGIVYQARQVSLGRKVALKVLGQALTQDTDLARFRREAMAAARLKHPGIATLYFVGQDADLCYHVMELVNGIPLQRVIDRLSQDAEVHTKPESVVATELATEQRAPTVRFDEPPRSEAPTPPDNRQTTDFSTTSTSDRPSVPLSSAARQTRRGKPYVRRCCEIARDVARALAYAHAEGVVHRDIKPGNLMLDAKGHVSIIDFGLARFFDDASVTSTGQLIGTPLYMSPEQVTGRVAVDHRSDVYSLGLVLYELLSLRRPFEATSRENLLRIIVTKALPPLSARNPELPGALEAIVHKATQKDPEERYQSAEEFANDLDRFLDGKTVAAPPYRYRLDVGEITARRPSAVVLAAFIWFMAGCVGFVGLTAMAAMMFFMGLPPLVPVVQALIGLALLAGTGFLSHGLLTGWSWVRWVVAGLTAIVIILSLVACIALVGMAYSMQQALARAPAPAKQGGEADSQAFDQNKFVSGMVAMYSVPLVMAFLCATTTLVCLFTAATRAWFRLAQQTRREHWEMLRTLGE